MVSITFKGINLEDNSSHGMWYPINCERCGPSASSVPVSGVDTLSLQDLRVTCVKCNQPVYVLRADYDFQRVAFNLLFDAGITRQQARQFKRLVDKEHDLDWIVRRSALIDPRLEQVTKIAKKEPNPRSALRKLVHIAAYIASFAIATQQIITGADDLWDRYRDSELFEPSPSQNAKGYQQNRQSTPDNGPSDPPIEDNKEQGFDFGIDV